MSELVSFDGTERTRGELVRPDRYRQLFADLSSGAPSIPRGAGLSYCNASGGDGVRSVSALCFDRILDFDAETGLVDVEPGLSVGALVEFALERGWRPHAYPSLARDYYEGFGPASTSPSAESGSPVAEKGDS